MATVAMLGFAAPSTVFATQPVFRLPFTTTALEYGGQRVAAGDFNEDGTMDVVAVTGSTDIYVLDGIGDGLFAAPRRYNGDALPNNFTLINDVHSLLVRDVNLDGHLDVVNANYRTVHLLVGDGHGGLAAPLAFDMGLNCDDIRVEDLGGDGIADLLAVNSGLSSISIRRGRGDGTFLGRESYFGPAPLGIGQVVDLDGDDRLDVITTRSSGDSLDIFWNDGAGHFDRVETIDAVSIIRFVSLAAGDLNGDNLPDLVMTRFTSTYDGGYQTLVRLGLGGGRFAEASVYQGFYGELSIADFDGDTVPDVVGSGGGVILYRGLGDGRVDEPRTVVGLGNGTVPVLLDLNHDGRTDVVSGGAGVSIALTLPSGGFPIVSRVQAPRYTFRAALADMDGNAWPDIVGVSSSSSDSTDGFWYFVPGLGDGTLGTAQLHPVDFDPYDVSLGDWNSDDRTDAVMVPRDGARLAIFFGDGQGGLAPGPDLIVAAEPVRLRALEVTGDDFPDIVVSSHTATATSVFPGSPGGFAARRDYPAPGTAATYAFGDLDGDGRTDMLLSGGAETLFHYRGVSGGEFERRTDILLPRRAGAIALADIDGDAGPELVATDFDSLRVYELGTAGEISRYRSYSIGGYAYDVTAVDVNRDERVDLVVDLDGSAKSLFLGQPDGTLSLQQFAAVGTGRAALGDMNGDGWPDLAVTDGFGVALYLNEAIPPIRPEAFRAEVDGWDVRLTWSLDPTGVAPDGFDIERRDPGSDEPIPLNLEPVRGNASFTFLDTAVQRPGVYEYRLRSHDRSGEGLVLAALRVTVDPELAVSRVLESRPNPFQQSTSIDFETAAVGEATLEVYDIVGRLVRRLRLGPTPIGRGTATWDGRRDDGRPCPSGNYFVRLVGQVGAVHLVRIR